ncbi:MAG: type IV toxin-antitoxin system AbiEi family antitoxin domain-containing protein [Bacteroidales bacterium]|nr:type IV toxin-antitoxin system AbiEi family antitoxin domain-containing protein [Bacteroidales bacterium]
MTKQDKILNIFRQNGGIVKLKMITEQGINKYHLQKLVENGVVEKIQHGIYKLASYQINELVEIKKIIPNGIICLYSAWNYYELTTYIPHEYHVAIEKKSKIKLPDYPPIKIYYWDSSILQLGINQVKIDTVKIDIYNIEKSVCDVVKFRNKIGKDILNEILTNYLQRTNKNIDKLIKYAKQLRVDTILKNYLDVLL